MQVTGRLAVAVVAVVLLTASILIVSLHETRRNADQIVRSSYELFRQGHRPTLDDVRQRFGRELKQTSPCKDFGCSFEVTVSNRLLTRLHLARYTVLKSSFWVRNGLLDENVVEFWTVREGGWMILAYTDAKYCNGCNPFSIGGNSVSVDSDSQASEQRAAFGFNTYCFSSLRACASAAELLPAVRRD